MGARHGGRGLARFPGSWDSNAVRVERPLPPETNAADLVSEADRLQAGLDHRKLEFEDEETGAWVVGGLRTRGWTVERMVWMRHDGAEPGPSPPDLREVPRAVVRALEREWLTEEEIGSEAQIREAIADSAAIAALRSGRELILAVEDVVYVALRLAPERSAAVIEDAYCTRPRHAVAGSAPACCGP